MRSPATHELLGTTKHIWHIKVSQSIFTHHGTYIVGFLSTSKHMAMAPERATMIHFEPAMRERGTDFGKMFARQP